MLSITKLGPATIAGIAYNIKLSNIDVTVELDLIQNTSLLNGLRDLKEFPKLNWSKDTLQSKIKIMNSNIILCDCKTNIIVNDDIREEFIDTMIDMLTIDIDNYDYIFDINKDIVNTFEITRFSELIEVTLLGNILFRLTFMILLTDNKLREIFKAYTDDNQHPDYNPGKYLILHSTYGINYRLTNQHSIDNFFESLINLNFDE